jgi:hypothetical protein
MIVTYIHLLITGRSKGFFKKLAFNLDVFGNSQFADLFNAALITIETKYEFGKPKDTISKILGLNLFNNTLTITGKIVVFLLTKNHCLNAARKPKVQTNMNKIKEFIKSNISGFVIGLVSIGAWLATIYNLYLIINHREQFQLIFLVIPTIAFLTSIITYNKYHK